MTDYAQIGLPPAFLSKDDITGGDADTEQEPDDE